MTTKKNFTKASPALAYIDIPEENDEIEDDKIIVNEEKTNSTFQQSNQTIMNSTIFPSKDTETKSKRVQVLLQPSVYEAVKQIAITHNTSVNDTINSLLKASTKGILAS